MGDWEPEEYMHLRYIIPYVSPSFPFTKWPTFESPKEFFTFCFKKDTAQESYSIYILILPGWQNYTLMQFIWRQCSKKCITHVLEILEINQWCKCSYSLKTWLDQCVLELCFECVFWKHDIHAANWWIFKFKV